MRLISYLKSDGTASYGLALQNGQIKDCGDVLRRQFKDLRAVLAASALDQLGDTPGTILEQSDITLTSPLPNPDKIICIGLNYQAHLEETGMEKPKKPSIFTRYPSSLVAQGQDIIRPLASSMHDYEGELAVVIGTAARHVKEADAMEHIAGYTCLNDGSIRDFQGHTTQFWPGKNFVGSGAIGPAIVTTDELPDPNALSLETRLNGETVQASPVSDLAFKIPELIAYLSCVTELLPGDIIATGTPSGVGLYREPRLFLKHGDKIEIEISGIGILSNGVRDEVV